jgi:hypothetical protein
MGLGTYKMSSPASICTCMYSCAVSLLHSEVVMRVGVFAADLIAAISFLSSLIIDHGEIVPGFGLSYC